MGNSIGLESSLSSLMFKTVLFGIHWKSGEGSRVCMGVKGVPRQTTRVCQIFNIVPCFERKSRNYSYIHFVPNALLFAVYPSSSDKTFCPCSSLPVFLDMCGGARRQASDQCSPPRQTFTRVSTNIITARSVQQERGLSLPCVHYCDCSFTQLLQVWKSALRSATLIPALHILAWSTSDRMSGPVWDLVSEGCCLAS